MGRDVRLKDSANNLLEEAQEFADNSPVNFLHVILAELESLDRHVRLETEIPILNKLMTDKPALTMLRGTVFGASYRNHATAAPVNNMTAELNDAIQTAYQRAGGVPVSDVIFLGAILRGLSPNSHNELVLAIQQASRLNPNANLDLQTLQMELEGSFPSATQSPSTSHIRAQLIAPSSPRRYRQRHPQWSTAVIQQLALCKSPEIVVAYGEYGSPLDRIDDILADLLADRDYRSYDDRRIGKYQSVAELNMAILLALDPDKAAVEIQGVLQQVTAANAVLAIRRLELLKMQNDTSSRVKSALTAPGEALVLGIYEITAPEDNPQSSLELIGANARWIHIDSYGEQRARDSIAKYFEPEWREKGFTLTPDALNLLFILAPGVEVNKRHRAMPYFAIEVVNMALATLSMPSDREAIIQDMVEVASRRIQDLLTPTRSINYGSNEFVAALTEAQTSIQTLLRPTRATRGSDARANPGLQQITSALIMAHVLGSATMHFHFPPDRRPTLISQHQIIDNAGGLGR